MKRLKKTIQVLLVLVLLISTLFETRASIIDDILSNLGFGNKTEQSIENYDDGIDKEELDENQKEVIAKIKDIYLDIININIDDLIGSIDYKVPSIVEKNVKEFFDGYENAREALSPILKAIGYKIEDIKYVGEDLNVSINIEYPLMDELVKKIIPGLVFKTPDLLIGRKIDNDILISALELMRNEIKAGGYNKGKFTYDFKFKKIGDEWKLTDMQKVIDDVSKYAREIAKSVLK